MSTLAIVEAFQELPDLRRGAGRRHDQALCLALFTLSVSAGCSGFIAISDWLASYQVDLLALFKPAKDRLPSSGRPPKTVGKPGNSFDSCPVCAFQALSSVIATP